MCTRTPYECKLFIVLIVAARHQLNVAPPTIAGPTEHGPLQKLCIEVGINESVAKRRKGCAL